MQEEEEENARARQNMMGESCDIQLNMFNISMSITLSMSMFKLWVDSIASYSSVLGRQSYSRRWRGEPAVASS